MTSFPANVSLYSFWCACYYGNLNVWMFNLWAERELLITQGLNDLDIQEDQNAVFICELTVEDIPGEWYKNGERIQPTSTVKIRQEGQS